MVMGYKIEPGAKLSNANLSGANLYEANLSGANLTNANLSGAKLHYVKLIGAKLDGTQFIKAIMPFADLSGAKIEVRSYMAVQTPPNLQGAWLQGANLSGLYLPRANLRDAKLDGANLSKADLREADLRGAKLQLGDGVLRNFNGELKKRTGTNLSGANLERANFGEYANLRGVDLSNANLTRVNLFGADFKNVNLLGANLSWVKMGSLVGDPMPVAINGSNFCYQKGLDRSSFPREVLVPGVRVC
jgi:uncharacterized protein YjbI with pentapeptide repeats